MVFRLLFIIPKGNRIAVPYRDQNTYYMLGRALVDDGFFGPPTMSESGPYYEYREKNPPPMGGIPEIRQKMMDRWDAEKRYYGVVKWGEPSSFFEPLYPVYSALCYVLFGDRFLFHRILLALMSSFTCIIVFKIGKRLFNDNTGYISALICAVYPYFIFYTVFLMSETFLIFFLALSMYYFFELRHEPGWKNAVLLGLMFGLTFLTRSIILGVIPFLLLYLVIFDYRRQIVPVVISVVVFSAVLAPWVIRNYNLHGQFVLLSTRGGYNIWLRNNPFYYEDELKALGYAVPQHLLRDIKYIEYLDYPEFSEDMGEIERNKILTEEGKKFILRNPKLFTYLCWIRLQTILGFHGTLSQGLIYKLVGILSFGILFPCALISLIVNRRYWKEFLPLVLIFGYFVSVYTLTHDGIRYRLPADPYLFLIASLLLAQVFAWISGKLNLSAESNLQAE